MPLDAKQELDVLTDEHARSVTQLAERVTLRKKLGLSILIALLAMLYKSFDPENFTTVTTGLLAKWAGAGGNAPINGAAPQWVLGSLLWIAATFLMVEAYSMSIHIEHAARRIRQMEVRFPELGLPFPSTAILPRPAFFRYSDSFYFAFIPCLILIAMTYVIWKDLANAIGTGQGWVAFYFVVDLICFLVVVTASVLCAHFLSQKR